MRSTAPSDASYVRALVVATDDALAERADTLSLRECGAQLVALTGVLDRLQAVVADRFRSFDDRDGATLSRARDAASWLDARTSVGTGQARAQARLATRAAMLPALRAVWESGAVSAEHVRAVAGAMRDERSRALLSRRGAEIARLAATMTPQALRQIVERWKAEDLARYDKRDTTSDRDRMHLSLYNRGDGMVRIDGLLDGETGALVTVALESLADAGRTASQRQSATPAADGESVPIAGGASVVELPMAQRRAVALGVLCRKSLDRSEGASSAGGVRPHLTVTVDLAVLAGLVPGVAELDRSGPISLPALRRITCDTRVSTVFRNGERIVAVSSSSRYVDARMRRAVDARDKGCRWRGCHIPAAWCEAHHVEHWADGGPTSIENTALLCSAHHHDLHDRGHQLDLRPPWTEQGSLEKWAPPTPIPAAS